MPKKETRLAVRRIPPRLSEVPLDLDTMAKVETIDVGELDGTRTIVVARVPLPGLPAAEQASYLKSLLPTLRKTFPEDHGYRVVIVGEGPNMPPARLEFYEREDRLL